jgi:hypothetical protein
MWTTKRLCRADPVSQSSQCCSFGVHFRLPHRVCGLVVDSSLTTVQQNHRLPNIVGWHGLDVFGKDSVRRKYQGTQLVSSRFGAQFLSLYRIV